MLPGDNSSFDREMANSERRAGELLDPDTAQIGQSIDHDTADQIDDAGWDHLCHRLRRRGLGLTADDIGHRVVAIEQADR